MIIRKSTLLSILLSAGSTTAYFAQVANAHVEFVATAHDDESSSSGTASSAAETVDNRSSLQSNYAPALWSTLETALQQKSELGYAAPKIMSMFNDWVVKFEKEYESLEEKSKRMLVWLENHVLIETHNSKESSFTLGHNEYSDLTHDEFRERMKIGEFSSGLSIPAGGKKFNFMEYNEVVETKKDNKLLRGQIDSNSADEEEAVAIQRRRELEEEETTDWHEKGLMGPIRNQGVCGACWAFSAVGSIESAMAIDKYNKMTPHQRKALEENAAAAAASKDGSTDGPLLGNDLGLVIPLSEQDLIDCDTVYEKGCKGGLMTTTFEEEEVKKGICSEVDYPYLQTEGTCSADLCTPVPGSIVKDQVDIIPRKTNALKQALKVQPVTAAMVATDAMFQFYSSGIYSAEGCGKVTKKMGDKDCETLYEGQDTCLPDINHGVLVVGYGTDNSATTDVKGYFKVKNSWGEGWGEGGYFRLARWEEDKTDPTENWGECAILTLLSYPVMQ